MGVAELSVVAFTSGLSKIDDVHEDKADYYNMDEGVVEVHQEVTARVSTPRQRTQVSVVEAIPEHKDMEGEVLLDLHSEDDTPTVTLRSPPSRTGSEFDLTALN